MKIAWTCVALAGVCSVAGGQIDSNFESPVYAGSPAGTGVAGQDGWYVPAVAGSLDQFVYTYEANALLIMPNPTGGDQFLGGTSGGGTALARAQRDQDFSAGGEWTAAWDMAVTFTGPLPSAPNLGSFSLQPTLTNISWQTLYNWVDVNTCTAWNCAFLPYDAVGVQAAQPGPLPDPAFGNLTPNHWYRISVTWSFADNRIHSTSITDLSTGATVTAQPVDWYLLGGAAPAAPMPTAVRFFSGGNLGNAVAVDNIRLIPPDAGPPCDPDYNQDGNADQEDVAYLVGVIAGGPNPTGRDPDFNQDGNIDQDDYRALVDVIAGGPCP
jgi:hypothetical protein